MMSSWTHLLTSSGTRICEWQKALLDDNILDPADDNYPTPGRHDYIIPATSGK